MERRVFLDAQTVPCFLKIRLPGSFFLCPLQTFSGQQNMGFDLFLYRRFGPEIFLRFYRWKRPTLSFGRNSYCPESIDENFCEVAGIDRVRRPTGGKTVFHHLEITYSLIAPVEFFPGGVLKSSKIVGTILQRALKICGAETLLNEKKDREPKNNICFRETGNYELKAAGKKLVGSAQKRNRTHFLQHGSIILDADFELWKNIWKLNSIDGIRSKVTSLREILGVVPDEQTLCATILQEFQNYLQKSAVEFSLKDYSQQISICFEEFNLPEISSQK